MKLILFPYKIDKMGLYLVWSLFFSALTLRSLKQNKRKVDFFEEDRVKTCCDNFDFFWLKAHPNFFPSFHFPSLNYHVQKILAVPFAITRNKKTFLFDCQRAFEPYCNRQG